MRKTNQNAQCFDTSWYLFQLLGEGGGVERKICKVLIGLRDFHPSLENDSRIKCRKLCILMRFSV